LSVVRATRTVSAIGAGLLGAGAGAAAPSARARTGRAERTNRRCMARSCPRRPVAARALSNGFVTELFASVNFSVDRSRSCASNVPAIVFTSGLEVARRSRSICSAWTGQTGRGCRRARHNRTGAPADFSTLSRQPFRTRDFAPDRVLPRFPVRPTCARPLVNIAARPSAASHTLGDCS
jgi:hypothetical protein